MEGAIAEGLLADGIRPEGHPGKTHGSDYLINRLHGLIFRQGVIQAAFFHTEYAKTYFFPLTPTNCTKQELTCVWQGPMRHDFGPLIFQGLYIPKDEILLFVRATLHEPNEETLRFTLPDTCLEIRGRKVARQSCAEINIELYQNSVVFRGHLVDYNIQAFHIEIEAVGPQTFQWIDLSQPVFLVLKKGGETLYSAICPIIKQATGSRRRRLLLEIPQEIAPRYRAKEVRSLRQALVPSPIVKFIHPLTGDRVSLLVEDLSGSGFSVEEDERRGTLFPGLVIPEMSLSFAQGFDLPCRGQVIYCRESSLGDEFREFGTKRCGFAILDLDIRDQVRLQGMLQAAREQHSSLCQDLDVEALLDLFFETGFIYSKKMELLRSKKKSLLDTYQRLYTGNPEIARHFTYQENSLLLAHIGMVRCYSNTWLIHHHAAQSSSQNRAGVVVLNQLSRSIIDSHRLKSAHMDYVICYYNPANRWASRMYGGVHKFLDDNKKCSLDCFGQITFPRTKHPGLRPVLQQRIATKEDLIEWVEYYQHSSGGVLPEALDMIPNVEGVDSLCQQFRTLGFQREYQIIAFREGRALKAMVLAQFSDFGLNMSNLTNCIKVFVVDQSLSEQKLYSILESVWAEFKLDETMTLVHPLHFLEKQNIPFEKEYRMFAINTAYSDQYFDCLKRLFRFIEQKTGKNDSH